MILYKKLVSVSGDFNDVWHHADFAHDIRQVYAIARGKANKGAIDATIFLFSIQALNIGGGSINRRCQVSQSALMVNISTLISVMNSCSVSLSHSTAINFSGSFW
ncbi:Uncharacterised protein [Salmonella bongori]|nr:Uncharacterised protein [Salmonella bongori]